MDWHYVGWGLRQGVPGLALLTATTLAFAFDAEDGQRARACAPGLAVAAVYLAGTLLAVAEPEQSAWAWVYAAAMAAPVVLLKKSVLSLRHPMLGVLHLATLVAIAYLGFVGSVVLMRDTV